MADPLSLISTSSTPRWQLSQISYPGDVQDIKFPTHVHLTKSNN